MPRSVGTRHRESLQTKNEAEARRLIAAKNQAASQPVFNLEMAKVYLKAHDPQFCERTWSLVSDEVQAHKPGGRSSSAASRWRVSSKRNSFRRPPAIFSPCLIIPRQAFPPMSSSYSHAEFNDSLVS